MGLATTFVATGGSSAAEGGGRGLEVDKGMKGLLAAIALALACASAQAPVSREPKFDGARAFEELKAMVALGPRPAGSAALEKNRDYIRKQLAAAGLKVEEQPFDAQTPAGTIHK